MRSCNLNNKKANDERKACVHTFKQGTDNIFREKEIIFKIYCLSDD